HVVAVFLVLQQEGVERHRTVFVVADLSDGGVERVAGDVVPQLGRVEGLCPFHRLLDDLTGGVAGGDVGGEHGDTQLFEHVLGQLGEAVVVLGGPGSGGGEHVDPGFTHVRPVGQRRDLGTALAV